MSTARMAEKPLTNITQNLDFTKEVCSTKNRETLLLMKGLGEETN